MQVLKRDKSIEQFSYDKIEKAIQGAYADVNIDYDPSIMNVVKQKFSDVDPGTISIEEIEDTVEKILSHVNFDVCRAYIIYRYNHKLFRDEKNDFVKKLTAKLGAKDIDNQNANVDEHSFGGRLGEATRIVTKQLALGCMSKMSRNNHLKNEIYVHDLDHYYIGDHNCAHGNSWIKVNYNGTIKTEKIKDFADKIGLKKDKIADLSKSNIEIMSRNGWTKMYNITCRETKDDESLYTFKTRTGIPFTVTGDHRLPILRDGKEIISYAKDIHISDQLLGVENIQMSQEEISNCFLNLMDLDDPDLDLRITNTEPIKHYMRYKYDVVYAQYFKKMGFDLTPSSRTIKVKDFKKLLKDYPIPLSVLNELRIKANGSKKDYPLYIPYSRELAKLYAYIYADGGVYENYKKKLHQLTFANKNSKIMDDFLDCYENVFGYRPNKRHPNPNDPNNVCIVMTDGSKVTVRLFKKFAGARKNGSGDMSVPDFVINGPKDLKYAYISACIDTDGCISTRGLVYCSCCKSYLEQLNIILTNLGIHSNITKTGNKGGQYNVKGHTGQRNYDSYILGIYRNDEIASLKKYLNTYKNMDAYSYRGLNNKFEETAIISIKKEVNPGTLVYDIQTGDHWFILNNYVSHNCLSVPFDELLSGVIKTRQADIRPAKSVNTAFQLVAVAFQLQSLVQFGGVSATHLDWTLVPYVRMSFFKHFVTKYIEENIKEDEEITSELKEKLKKEFKEKYHIEDEDFKIGDFSMKCINFHVDDPRIKEINPQWYKDALFETKEEIKQAVEGMYHNLNTLQSRSGWAKSDCHLVA